MKHRKQIRLDTCWHEAGHVVIALIQGLHVREVTVVETDDANGSCIQPSLLMYDASRREQRTLARACIIASYAGLEAERLYNPSAPDLHGEQDRENAFDVSREYQVFPRNCGFVGSEGHLRFLESLRLKAHKLVLKHRRLIERVAEQLSKSHTMSGEEVSPLIGLP